MRKGLVVLLMVGVALGIGLGTIPAAAAGLLASLALWLRQRRLAGGLLAARGRARPGHRRRGHLGRHPG